MHPALQDLVTGRRRRTGNSHTHSSSGQLARKGREGKGGIEVGAPPTPTTTEAQERNWRETKLYLPPPSSTRPLFPISLPTVISGQCSGRRQQSPTAISSSLPHTNDLSCPATVSHNDFYFASSSLEFTTLGTAVLKCSLLCCSVFCILI